MNVNPFDIPIAPLETKKDTYDARGLQRLWEQPAVEKEIKITPASKRRTIQDLMYPKTFHELVLKSRLILKSGKK